MEPISPEAGSGLSCARLQLLPLTRRDFQSLPGQTMLFYLFDLIHARDESVCKRRPFLILYRACAFVTEKHPPSNFFRRYQRRTSPLLNSSSTPRFLDPPRLPSKHIAISDCFFFSLPCLVHLFTLPNLCAKTVKSQWCLTLLLSLPLRAALTLGNEAAMNGFIPFSIALKAVTFSPLPRLSPSSKTGLPSSALRLFLPVNPARIKPRRI